MTHQPIKASSFDADAGERNVFPSQQLTTDAQLLGRMGLFSSKPNIDRTSTPTPIPANGAAG